MRITKFLPILLLFFPKLGLAQPWSCREVFQEYPGFHFTRDGNKILKQLEIIEIENSGLPVLMDWSLILPVKWSWKLKTVRPVDPFASYVFAPQGKPKSYSIGRMHGPGKGNQYIERVLENYSIAFDNSVLKLVKDVSNISDGLRADQVEIILNPTGEKSSVVGTAQIYDASVVRMAMTNHQISGDLPVQLAMKLRDIPSKIDTYFENLLAADPTLRLFEIGRLTATGSKKQTKAILLAIEAFISSYYIKHFPNSYFVAHVASTAHLRLFTSRYKMNLIDSIELADGSKEFVLGIKGKDFAEVLEQRKREN